VPRIGSDGAASEDMAASGRQKRTKGRVGKHVYAHVYVHVLSLQAEATISGFHLTFRRVT